MPKTLIADIAWDTKELCGRPPGICFTNGNPAEGGKEWRVSRDPEGLVLGDAALREELLAAASERVGANHYGSDRRETGEAKARRLIAATLAQIGWKVSDLKKERKGAPEKVELARRLRKETIMSLKWIAKELEMGSWTYVSNLLGTTKSLKSKD